LAQGYRPDRVGEQIRDVISEILTRGEVHDPGIGFITLTRVQVTSDLQIARVFYTTLGDPKARKETARALDRATPFFRRQVAGRLRLRRAPEFEFRFDESIENQDRIERILRDLHDEDAQRAQDTTASPEPDPGSRPSASSGRPEPVEGQIPNPEPDDDDTSHD
jgi:ribosome-binding factor A